MSLFTMGNHKWNFQRLKSGGPHLNMAIAKLENGINYNRINNFSDTY